MKTRTKTIHLAVTFLFCLLLPHAAFSAGQSGVTYDDADFSYQLPAGWQLMEMPGLKYKISHTTPADGFAPNITVVDENFNGSLKEYVELNIKALESAFQDFNKVSVNTFKTDSKASASKLVTENTQQGKKLYQIFYFFDGGSKKFVTTCTQLAGDNKAIEAACDSSMNTFSVK